MAFDVGQWSWVLAVENGAAGAKVARRASADVAGPLSGNGGPG